MLKIVKVYGREAFKFLEVWIMVTIPFDKKGFNAKEDCTVNCTVNFTVNETKVLNLLNTFLFIFIRSIK